MTASNQSPRALGHQLYTASLIGDGSPKVGPWPGMSARAALIARGLGIALGAAWLAAIDVRLMVLIAFALPFWIAIELEAPRFRRKRSAPVTYANVIPLPAFRRESAGRPSDNPTPRAA